MSMDIPVSQPPALPARTPPDNRSRNLGLAVVASIIIVCVGLTVIAQFANRDKIGKSDYPVKSFADAIGELGIEPVPQWKRFDGDGFTIYLPGRFEPLSESEQPTAPDLNGGQVRLIAMDTGASLIASNIMVMTMPASSGMTPGKYAWGTADEMKKGGYQVKDKSAYELGGRSVGRLIYETTTLFGQRASGVQFAYVEDGALWVVIGTVPTSDLENWLPVLQEITRKFELQPAGIEGMNTST